MNIDGISEGLVIDHISVGKAMDIYNYLDLNDLDCGVAIIKNAKSDRLGRKDIIKVESTLDINYDVLGFIDPNITVNVIKGAKIIQKKNLTLPKKIKGVIKCKNPRCISSVEPGLVHIFKLADEDERVYRCIYCEQEHTE